MQSTTKKLLVGLAIAGATAGLGAGFAWAQTDAPTTTQPPTTQAPSDQRPQDERDCPWKDRGGEQRPDTAPDNAPDSADAAVSLA
jgi:hypothetical protein